MVHQDSGAFERSPHSHRHETRRLAALMFTDIAGFSRHAHREEEATIRLVEEQARMIRSLLPEYGGEVLKTTGDGFFIEFRSVVEAVRFGCEIQARLYEWNLSIPYESRLWVRIGIHLGDVIATGEDTFGDDVNISSRLEKYARPGGICVSHAVMEQVAGKLGVRFREELPVKLRNIQRPMKLHSIVLPWLADERGWATKLLSRDGIRDLVRGAANRFAKANDKTDRLIAGVLAATIIGCFLGATIPRTSLDPDTERVDSTEKPDTRAVERISLSEGWQVSFSGGRWEPFAIDSPWSSAEQSLQDYSLKVSFVPTHSYQSPAISLGDLPDRHRVFLNGNLIGASNRQSSVDYFAFDPRVLKPGQNNTLVIQSFRDGALYQGLTAVPKLNASIGEVDDVTRTSTSQKIFSDSSRLVYLAVTLLLFGSTAVFYALNPSKRKYLYFALFLLLGFMIMAYYNPLLTTGLGFRRFALLKLFPMALSGTVLVSLFISMEGTSRVERANNLFGAGLGLFVTYFICPSVAAPCDFVGRINWSYGSIFLYCASIAFCMLSHLIHRARNRAPGVAIVDGPLIFGSIIVAFTLINGVFALASLRGDIFHLLPAFIRSIYDTIAVAYPAFYAMIVLFLGIGEYRRNSRHSALKRKQDDLMLRIARLVSVPGRFERKLDLIQKRICEYLDVERSTFYVVDHEQPDFVLKAQCTVRPPNMSGKLQVERVVPNQGLIGYVYKNRSAILLRNVAEDPRFSDLLRQRRDVGKYKTSSCMILPLVVGNDFMGMLTFADKRNGGHLTEEDFHLLHMLAKDLALMVSNFRFQQMLEIYAKSPIVNDEAA